MNRLILLLSIIVCGCIRDDQLKLSVNFQPLPHKDFVTGSLSAAGIDSLKIIGAVDYFFSESHLPNSKALLIVKDDKIVLESYARNDTDRDRLHNIKSITKSITSVLIGIVVQDGLLDSDLDIPVYDYIPEHFDDDLEKRKITIEHCLSMTTGLEDPFYTVSSILPDHSVSTCLGVELVDTPGTKYAYNNGSTNILGGVISKVTQMPFGDYAKMKLFDRINIDSYHWVKHRDGNVNPAFDLYLTPHDILKFGRFCLENGVISSQPLMPSDWLRRSTSPNGLARDFGYHWWIDDEHEGYYAAGHGGQRLWIYPNQELMILHLSEPSTDQTDLSEVDELHELIMLSVQ